jgi:hypothetical protein
MLLVVCIERYRKDQLHIRFGVVNSWSPNIFFTFVQDVPFDLLLDFDYRFIRKVPEERDCLLLPSDARALIEEMGNVFICRLGDLAFEYRPSF